MSSRRRRFDLDPVSRLARRASVVRERSTCEATTVPFSMFALLWVVLLVLVQPAHAAVVWSLEMTGDQNSRYPGVTTLSNTTPGLSTFDPVVYTSDGTYPQIRMGTPIGFGLHWRPDIPRSVATTGFEFNFERPDSRTPPLSAGTYQVNHAGTFIRFYVQDDIGAAVEYPGKVVINSAEWVTDGVSLLDLDFEINTAGSAVANVRGHIHFEDTTLRAAAPGRISGYAWRDANRDGNRDPNEDPLANTSVTLLDEFGNGLSPAVVTKTDATGHYEIRYRPGRFRVRFGVPERHAVTVPNSGSDELHDSDVMPAAQGALVSTDVITLAADDNLAGVDVGFVDRRAQVELLTWIDLDRDGIHQDGEPWLDGAQFSLYQGGKLLRTVTIYGIMLGQRGRTFIDVEEGQYTGQFNINSLQTGASGGAVPFSVSPQGMGADRNLDSDVDPSTLGVANFDVAGNNAVSLVGLGLIDHRDRIRGQAWIDRNANGIREAGEPPAVGLTLTAYSGDSVVSTTYYATDVAGYYELPIMPGRYRLAFSGYHGYLGYDRPTKYHVGSDPTVDSDVDPATGKTAEIDVSGDGTIYSGIDIGYGFEYSSTVTGYVWSDVNGNGIQDAGEPPLAQRTIDLIDKNGSFSRTTTTDSTGHYTALLVSGTYSVRPAKGATEGFSPRAVNGYNDSDVDPALGETRPLYAAQNQTVFRDVGIIPDAPGVARLSASDYFPLRSGASWMYKTPNGFVASRDIQGIVNISGVPTAMVTTQGQDTLYLAHGASGLAEYRAVGKGILGSSLDVVFLPPVVALPAVFPAVGTYSSTSGISAQFNADGTAKSYSGTASYTHTFQGFTTVDTQFGRVQAIKVLTTLTLNLAGAGSTTINVETEYAWGIGEVASSSNGVSAVLLSYRSDMDGDGMQDLEDKCPSVANPGGSDLDDDGAGDACDLDRDDDHVLDTVDNCPVLPNPDQKDTDGDGTGDVCDNDKDDDGIDDKFEVAQGLNPADPSDALADADNDGVSNLDEYIALVDLHDARLTPVSAAEILLGTGVRGGGASPAVDPMLLQPNGTTSVGAKISIDTSSNPDLAGYAANQRAMHPAWCDVDGDGRKDLVIGLGSGGRGWIEVKDDAATGFAHLKWLRAPNWDPYYTTNGESFPACGDLDGDGKDEIVIGYGKGSGGWVWVVDDAAHGYAPMATPLGGGWLRGTWTTYNATNGASYPAVGDLDGDGRAEIALGGDTGRGGWVQTIDDAVAGFGFMPTKDTVGWVPTGTAKYDADDGAVWPAICNLNGNLTNELVVGSGAGIQVLDPATGYKGAEFMPVPDGWLATPISGVPGSYVPLHLSCGKLFPSARQAIVAASGGSTQGQISVYGFVYVTVTRLMHTTVSLAGATVAGLWPAIGGEVLQDSDHDGMPDASDAFPNDRTEWADTDADGIGDNADTDDDNDGLPDTFETQYGLDPKSAAGVNGAGGDFDGDGLTNADERTRGTLPNNADSDSDGMKDGAEMQAGLNPLADDSALDPDGDGVPNGVELQAGTDPHSSASKPHAAALLLIGAGAGGQGQSPLVDPMRIVPEGQTQALAQVSANLATNADLAGYTGDKRAMHPAWCDVDGDGRKELVVGFGPGGRGWIEVLDDAATSFAHLTWLQAPNWAPYYAANGESFPACGDLDGDGKDELVFGYGPGSGGWVWVVDDAAHNYAPLKTPIGGGWLRGTYTSYNTANGASYPAVGDLDGDGRAEIVLGGGKGRGGWLQAIDDAVAGFGFLATKDTLGWIPSGTAAPNAADGTVWPAICDLDGSGRTELVLGTAAGLQVLDTATTNQGAAFMPVAGGWLTNPANWSATDRAPHPACGNLVGDAKPELAVVPGDVASGNYFALYGVSGGQLARLSRSSVPAGQAWADGWPAIGGEILTDSDGDGVPDSMDAFPNDPTESADTDHDGSGDNADTDDDNDGLPDVYELAHGLDPKSASGAHGAGGDLDGDGLTNTQEYVGGTLPNVQDTDADAIDDGYEVAHGWNPLVDDSSADADGDGASNKDEYLGGSDPNDPTSLPLRQPIVAIGTGPGGNGHIELVGAGANNGPRQYVTLDVSSNAELAGYAQAQREVRPAWCNVDGDIDRELVIGLGKGGRGWVEIRDDSKHHYAHLAWVKVNATSDYYTTNGETFPACGDLDGDTRDELVLGLGTGGGGRAYLVDDALANYAPLTTPDGGGWLVRKWDVYNAKNGEIHPAVGDLDNDGKQEIVLAGGDGNAGWAMVFDDATQSFKQMTTPYGGGWIRAEWAWYNTQSGAVWPAVCDRGNDHPIVVFGFGARSQGWVAALDPETQFKPYANGAALPGWYQTADAAYNQANGETRPGCVSNGGSYEYIKAYGRGAGGQGKVDGEGYDGGGAGWWTVQSTNQAYDATNGATWTSVNEAYHSTSIVTSGSGGALLLNAVNVP
ncbi:MAG: VCBS repeat-containing protein [Gammaproteobacteria bacterium]|nr:VCBS repeat-containing protein [Gammaproteobacteria bacterium]